jgi:methyl-accepting chemotaxis protein
VAGLEKVAASVNQVAILIEAISVATSTQAGDTHALRTAVGQVGSVTQQNAASAEESSSSAAELAQNAEQLARLVASFRLPEGVRNRAGGAPDHLPRGGAGRRSVPRSGVGAQGVF